MARNIVDSIAAAAAALDGRVVQTPLSHLEVLSARLDNKILIKREDMQHTYSFKLRGAWYKLLHLSAAARKAGVATASAGNHGKGLAYAARREGVQATIVMPRTAPHVKIDGVSRQGARVLLWGDNYDEASEHCRQLLADGNGGTYVHPFDDWDIIAGQGTVGLEIAGQCRGRLDAVFLPVGGGGLCAGVCAWLRHKRPDVRIYGVEPEGAACCQAALRAGRRVRLADARSMADGVLVSQIGKRPFEILREHLDDIITVSEAEMCAAVSDIHTDTRAMVELAGACALAGLKRYAKDRKGETLLAVASGANTSFERLGYVVERAAEYNSREFLFQVDLPNRAGSLQQFLGAVDRRIRSCSYRRAPGGGDDFARVFFSLEMEDGDERATLLESLGGAWNVRDLSDIPAVTGHLRHLVVPLRPLAGDQQVVRAAFYGGGGIRELLEHLGGRWNLSLLHYHHDGTLGRALMGIDVPSGRWPDAFRHLQSFAGCQMEQVDAPARELLGI